MLSAPLLPCCRYHPAEVDQLFQSVFNCPCCLRLRLRARPSELRNFEATYAFAFATAWQLATIPWMILSIDFRISVSLNPAILATGLLTFAPAGLSPAEYTSLYWTYNRTSSFPASGSSYYHSHNVAYVLS